MSEADNFPDQPEPEERNAGQLTEGDPPSRKDPQDIPDGGGDDDDKGEDEDAPE
ncbi:hypothetical protein [Phenylobacterium sp.]|uniref:hypothetical protein n=1 Tax=Phenylobacterium sp. TaxID=1871053 RepID=UPI0025E89F3F|nr:hypothetical protein [Phenylobacterium sp.]